MSSLRSLILLSSYRKSNPRQNQCIFIKGFRARRIFTSASLQAAVDPLPDDPDNKRDGKMKSKQLPDVSTLPAVMR